MSLAEVYPQDSIRLTVLPDGVRSGTMRLKNLQKARLAFKIKANIRNKYEVCPAQGFVAGGGQVTIEIILREKDTNCNVSEDKFLISFIACDSSQEMKFSCGDGMTTNVSSFFEGKEQEKVDIFRKVHLNEDLRQTIEGLKRKLDSRDKFIEQLLRDRQGNIEQILKMNHFIKTNGEKNISWLEKLLYCILLVTISVLIKHFFF